MSYLYFWGRPIIKQLQKPSNKSNINCIQTNQVVQQVSSGLEHAILLTETNQVYAMGSNIHGQCGAGYLKDIPIYKIIIPTKSKIVSISCGWYHTVILDQLGCVFTAGSGTQGATGQGNRENSYIFKQIMTGVRKISAGTDHSLAIKGNKVYGWGNNDYGQLGLHSKKNYLTPQQLNVYPSNQLCAGAKYSIFVTVKGVYGCGLNNNYQLGLGMEKNVNYPKALNIDDQIQKVYCGNYCVGKTKSNAWYIWGSGAFGVFKYPTKASFFQGCEKLSLGVSFGMMLKNDRIYVWGSNNYGQLGSDFDDIKDYAHESQTLTNLRLSEFCCGVNFGIGVSQQQGILNNNTSNDYDIESEEMRQTNYNDRNNILKYNNYNRLNNSIKTYYDPKDTTNEFSNNNQKMKTVHTDYQSRNKQSNIQSLYHQLKRKQNNKQGVSSNFGYSNVVKQNSSRHNDQVLSDQIIKRKTMPTFSHNNQTFNLYKQYPNKQSIYKSQYKPKISKQLPNKKRVSKQKINNNPNIYSRNQQTGNKQNNRTQKIYINQNHIHSSKNSEEDNKQNWANIQKLRKAINQHKKQSISNQSQSSSNRLKNTAQQTANQQYKKQFEQYGHNLQRLKQLLEQANKQKQLSSSNQQQNQQ